MHHTLQLNDGRSFAAKDCGGSGDCGPLCLAFLLSVPVADVRAKLARTAIAVHGSGYQQPDDVLRRVGAAGVDAPAELLCIVAWSWGVRLHVHVCTPAGVHTNTVAASLAFALEHGCGEHLRRTLNNRDIHVALFRLQGSDTGHYVALLPLFSDDDDDEKKKLLMQQHNIIHGQTSSKTDTSGVEICADETCQGSCHADAQGPAGR